jgi:hypothetical protein
VQNSFLVTQAIADDIIQGIMTVYESAPCRKLLKETGLNYARRAFSQSKTVKELETKPLLVIEGR